MNVRFPFQELTPPSLYIRPNAVVASSLVCAFVANAQYPCAFWRFYPVFLFVTNTTLMSDVKLTAQILSLYAGCPVRIQTGGIATIVSAFTGSSGGAILCSTGTDPHQTHNGLNPYYTNVFESKPILRPLLSITEDEACALWMICHKRPIQRGSYLKELSDLDYRLLADMDEMIGHPPSFLHLCSLGFDLFGLIDAGLAIDYTKEAKDLPVDLYASIAPSFKSDLQ